MFLCAPMWMRSMVFHKGDIAHKETLESFDCHYYDVGRLPLMVEDRDALKHPVTERGAPQNKELFGLKCQQCQG